MKTIVILLLAAAVASSVSAAPDPAHEVRLDASFAAQRAAIEAELKDGDKYIEISGEDRRRVVHLLDRIQRTLEGAEDVEAVPPSERAQLFNDQETVNQILLQTAEASRMICRREPTLGTRIPQSICHTKAQRDRMRDSAKAGFDRQLDAGRASNKAPGERPGATGIR